MKFDYEAELPTRHHRVYPCGAMTDIQKEGTAANPLTTTRRRRVVVRGGRCIIILDCQSSYHRDKPSGDVNNCNFSLLKVRPQGANLIV